MQGHGQTIVLLGPPHSGKSTLAKLLVQRAAFEAFDMGEHLRSIIANKNGHPSYQLVAETVASGKLLPNILAESIFTEAVRSLGDRHLVTDGFPRTPGAASRFLDVMKLLNRSESLASVVHMQIDADRIRALVESRGRDDDKKASVVSKRIEEYKSNLQPTLQRLSSSLPLVTLDFDNGVEANFAKLKAFLDERARAYGA